MAVPNFVFQALDEFLAENADIFIAIMTFIIGVMVGWELRKPK